MKRFLKRRWHSIPVALLSALLILALTVGGVFAYTAWTGTANIDVEEALRVDLIDGNVPGTTKLAVWDEGTETLTVEGLMPGEWAIASINVLSDSSVALPVTVEMVQTGGITQFQPGTMEDSINAAMGEPAPTYSWIVLVRGEAGAPPEDAYGNPLTFIVPATGVTPIVGGPVISLQAGASIEPGDYVFRLEVSR